MAKLLVVGGGLFGSVAAAYARSKGIETVVFDARLPGAASLAAAGLFKEEWAGKRFVEDYHRALPVLDSLYGIRRVTLEHDDGQEETFMWTPPALILEPNPIRERVIQIGNGWLETDNQRYEGWVYVAAGIWSGQFLPGLEITGKAGAAFAFAGERKGRIRQIAYGRQAIAFVRDKGATYFSDGTAKADFGREHENLTLERAAEMGLSGGPIEHYWGIRPYTMGGPIFAALGERTRLATGGRKMGTILAASLAKRLVDEELG